MIPNFAAYKRVVFGLLLIAIASTSACNRESKQGLKDVFADAFMIGTALNEAQVFGRDRQAVDLAEIHFNSITPENVTKWGPIHPEPGKYDFAAADGFVEFGERNGMFMVGHTLVWHSQTPAWVFQDDAGNPVSREVLLDRMRDHIHTVVGRYKGRIHGWDVVNEALDEDGSLRQSPWYRIIGEDYIARAFEYAREADPGAELYYNDYSLENQPKRDGAVRLMRSLKEQGVPVTGIGTQGHFMLDWPDLDEIEKTITEFAALGLDVMITELDIDVLPAAFDYMGADISRRAELEERLNPYPDGLPESVQQELARRYRDIFEVLLRHRDAVTRVTFWGITDRNSWKNNWPVYGRTNYPLLFDRDGKPKPAYYEVVDAAQEKLGGKP